MNISLKCIRQGFLMSATISVFLNGQEAAWLGPGDGESIAAPAGQNTLLFTFGLRKKEIIFEASQDVSVTVKMNRITGGIDVLANGPDLKLL